MSQLHDSVGQKVLGLFTEMAGERVSRLGEPAAQQTRDLLARALSAEYPSAVAQQIAFHLVDWHTDAAFMMAVHLFPDRFTPEELAVGADMLLIHAPNHLAAAAKLAGHPIQDVFGVGVLDDSPEDE